MMTPDKFLNAASPNSALSMDDIQNAIKAFGDVLPPPTYSVVVSSAMYPRVHRAINTREVRRIGLHAQCKYRKEIWWEIHKLPRKRAFDTQTLIRYRLFDYYSDGPASLPQAMKKRGYFVKDNKIQKPLV